MVEEKLKIYAFHNAFPCELIERSSFLYPLETLDYTLGFRIRLILLYELITFSVLSDDSEMPSSFCDLLGYSTCRCYG